MPGLSQLRQFNSDVVSLGDEVVERANRGEKPVKVSIPENIADINDSEDFVLGLPDNDNINNQSSDDNLTESDDLLSDDNLDMSGLLDSIDNLGSGDSSSDGMPDLSMFVDDVGSNESSNAPDVPEEAAEEVPVEDMSLEDLLSGADFGNADEKPSDDNAGDNSFDDVVFPDDDIQNSNDNNDDLDFSSPEDFSGTDDIGNTSGSDSNTNADDFEMPDFSDAGTGSEQSPDSFTDEFNLDDLGNMPPLDSAENTPDSNDTGNIPGDDFNNSDNGIDDFEMPDFSDAGTGSEQAPDGFTDEFNLDDLDSMPPLDSAEDAPDINDTGNAPEDDFNNSGNSGNGDDSIDDFEMPDFSDAENTNIDTDAGTGSEQAPDGFTDDFNLDDLGNLDTSDSSLNGDNPDNSLDNDFNLDDIGDFGNPDTDKAKDNPDDDLDSGFGGFSDEDNNLDAPSDVSDDDLDLPDMSDAFSENADEEASDDFNISDMNSGFEGSDFNYDLGDLTGDNETGDNDDFSSVVSPSDNIDLSENDNESGDFDFDIPDTDSQIDSDDGNKDDEFNIPGFSDIDNLGETKNTPHVKFDFSGGKDNNENVPANTLTDEQYKTFLKNLSEYPLNVRLAFEELLVKDEFTDDAEFELIETILNKASANQVAGKLEKMLDVSIPVPRDYEHRSADEYEAYKKSLSYQLRNKIIPAAIVGVVCILVSIGLFNFGKNCIYKPLKANSLYKQGYVLIQEQEYPLSEIKFKEATEYRFNKKWFFNYAREYRNQKQYQRAGRMYQNILYCFNHDKIAGLEYADMELNDLANYERAEEVVRREILDYHINDADGILKLGDIYLEWGTEKDPAKLEDARDQYATLLQLYGDSDLYMSRMMRYFIRTDNLHEVLMLKQRFEPKENSLCADDWTELSGYLLDKYFGELDPSEEYLRYQIEGIRNLLLRAVTSNPENPVALYNLARYFINTNENEFIESSLKDAIEKFNNAKSLKSRDLYKYIDSYRLLGEYYMETEDFLKAQEQLAEGISLYITERDNAGFKGTPEIGKIYEDMGDLKYSVSGDYDDALLNYNHSVNLGNDSPKIRYRIGYMEYNNRDYEAALSSFMKAGEGNIKERNLLLALANTLSLRGDDYAAEGYYAQLIENIDSVFAHKGLILPQADINDYNIVNTYLSASNNYGVTLYRLARKTGDSSKNADAIVQFSQSLRAWDALTRNPDTLIRMEGSNLAEQNIKYVTRNISQFEPAIYTNIPRTLLDNEKL